MPLKYGAFFMQYREVTPTNYLEILENSILFSISKENMDLLFSKYHKMEQLGQLVPIEILTKVVCSTRNPFLIPIHQSLTFY